VLRRAFLVASSVLALGAPHAAASITLSSTTLVAQRGLTSSLTAIVSVPAVGHNVGNVHIDAAAPPAQSSWIEIDGATGPVSPPVDVPFTITVSVPQNAPDGVYPFPLVARADGADVGDVTLVVEVGAGALQLGFTPPTFEASWKESRLLGGLAIRGTTPVAGGLTIQIRPKGGKLFRSRVYPVAPGHFTRVVHLQPNVQPGSYQVWAALVLTGATATGQKSLARSWFVRLQPPAQGYVDHAWISGLQHGPASLEFPSGARSLFAAFHFSFLPKAGAPITTTWYPPSGGPTASVAKPRASFVQGYVVNSTPLAAGRWRCVLRVGGVLVSETSVRVG
jgi:hypothetical protein